MSASITVSRAESGSADAVKAVSAISTGTVQIHPEHPFGTRKPLYWWLLTSRQWTPPRPVNAYVIEHAKGLILFDTGQDRASVTDDGYFPGGFTGLIYHRLARFDIGEQDTLAAQLAALGYSPADVDTAILSHLHQDHIGGIGELNDADLLVSADFENIPTWNYAIEDTSKASAGPVGVGTRYRQTRSIPRRSTEEFEVTVFQPARRLAIHGQIGPFQATISYARDAAVGSTRLVNRVELDPSQPKLRLLAPVLTPGSGGSGAEPRQLKLVLESGRPA
jgi:glyoxylase-like metal-dependent hydrolase (beta-lactamase superfamily II)